MSSIQKRAACIGIVVVTIVCSMGLGVCTLSSIVLRETKIAEQRKKAEQERISEAAHEIRDTLYVPADAVVLDEVEADDLLAYAPGCTGTVIQIAYGVNRSFDEVLAEYHCALLEAGWTLRPAYRQVEGYAVYLKGPRVKLSISKLDEDESLVTATPTPTPSTWKQFATIYRVTITYTEPSNEECIG